MSDQIDAAKDAAARAAVALVRPGMKLGLGSGSTAAVMVRRLAERNDAEPLELRCAATSDATATLAVSLGLKVETLDQIGWLDLAIDGADEIDPDLNLIKGGGGAHLREKIVERACDRLVVIADATKVVDRLGKFPLPVEVIPFGWESTRAQIERLLRDQGLGDREIVLRQRDGGNFRSDEGNYILDLHLDAIGDAHALSVGLNQIPGVVENGLFLNMCDLAIIGSADGSVIEFERDFDAGDIEQ